MLEIEVRQTGSAEDYEWLNTELSRPLYGTRFV